MVCKSRLTFKRRDEMEIRIKTTQIHGLETIEVYVNDVHSSSFMSLTAAIAWVKRKFPGIELFSI